MKKRKKAIAMLLATSLLVVQCPLSETTEVVASGEGKTVLTEDQVRNLYQEVSYNRQAVHDPSIVNLADVGESGYYVFGSHMGVAKTDDLMNWTSPEINGENVNNAYYGVKRNDGSIQPVSFETAFETNEIVGTTTLYSEDGTTYNKTFGTYNINQWISPNLIRGNMWAPDVIYNKEMKKWCMYTSLNGQAWNSAVVLLTADNVEGPYVYQAPIVFSGFQSSNNDKNGGYKNTDLELVLGTQQSLPTRYDQGNSWGTYWPHAIDPCVFYDDAGKLWLSYGSWSGGIYMLELDEKTGLRDYSVTYESNYDTLAASVTSDAYFGTKIAGGYYVSGEGSYIQKIGNYYYLFMSYGFYSPTGGYNMRIFRSENPDGPYVDANNASAIYTSWVDNYRSRSRGNQLMGNYQWDTMPLAEVAQGHNSAFVDTNGNAYVVYHTKFGNDTAEHQLRVHQLYQNEDGWLVAAPYEYAGETVNNTAIATTAMDKEAIVGDYDFIFHNYNNPAAKDSGLIADTTKIATPVTITLHEDGSLTSESGTYSGTWSQTEGTSYVTIRMNRVNYKGVFTEQCIDGTKAKVMCFSAISGYNNTSIWGSKQWSDEICVAYNANYVLPVETSEDLVLSTEGKKGVTISWSSSEPTVLGVDGKVAMPKEDTTVTLTRTVEKGNCRYQKDYKVLVRGLKNVAGNPKLGYETLVAGDYIPSVSSISETTGVSLSFTISGITSDWDKIFVTDNQEYVYLSVLNYGMVNLFEASGTVSQEAQNMGYQASNAWSIFTGGGTQDVKISYNPDGSIDFYRNGILMLSYGASTAIGSSTVADLSHAMARAAAAGQIQVLHGMTKVSLDYAASYTGSGIEQPCNVSASKWWGAWTRAYRLDDRMFWEFEVTDMVGGSLIYQNLVAVFSNMYTDGTQDPTQYNGYKEYRVVRMDNYSWVDPATTEYYGGIGEEGITDESFVELLKKASGTITISKSGKEITFYYHFLGENGDACSRVATVTLNEDVDSLYVFFTADHSSYTLLPVQNVIIPEGMRDISKYKKTNSYPDKDQKAFAGWFEDANYQKAISTEMQYGLAYEKFVDAKLLQVKNQITAGTTSVSESTNLRFMLGVDSLNYQKVGFDTVIGGTNRKLESNVVCSVINVTENGQTVSLTPATVFETESAAYMLSYKLTNAPNSAFNTEIQATPYWITLDGTKVSGTMKTFTISDAF